MKRRTPLRSIFGRLLFREVFHNWAQSIAIVAIGAIAVTLFVGLQANSSSMQARVDEMVAASNPADIYVTTDPHSLKAKNDSELILSALDEDDFTESRFYGYCTLESKNAMLAVSPFLPNLSKGYRITLDPNSTANDYFYIDRYVAEEFKLANPDEEPLGHVAKISFDLSSFKLNEVVLTLLDSFLKEGQKNPLRTGSIAFSSPVTGIMNHPENTTKATPIPFLTMMSSYRFKKALIASLDETFTEGGVDLLLREGFYRQLGWGDGTRDGSYLNFPSPNQYLIHLKDPSTADAKKEKIASAYERKAENNLYLIQTLSETSFLSTLKGEIEQAEKLTMVFPVVFFVVAVLVILTTFRQVILKRRGEIGAFKSLGLTKREIHAHFLGQTALLVGLSSLIGAIIGPILLPFIMAKKYDILYTLPLRHYHFPVVPGVAAIAIFMAVSLLVTFLITYKEIALKPVESMRPKAMKIHRRILHRSMKRQKSLGLSAKMAGRNLIYDPLKAFMVVIGMAGCTALLVCGFGIDDTLGYDIGTDPYVNSSSDVMVHFLAGQKQTQLEQDFSTLKTKEDKLAISSFQPYTRLSLEFIHDDVNYTSYLFVLGKATSFDGVESPDHLVGEFAKDKVLISTKVAETMHVSVGDEITFYFASQYVRAPVERIYDAFYGNGIVFHHDSPLLSAPYDEFQTAWANVREGIHEEELRQALLNLSYVPVVDTATEWMTRIHDMVSSIRTMTGAVKVFAILLALVVIYNLGLLNFRERVREIATLKVLGFHTLEIGVGLLIETLSMTLIGILGGLALGYPFMQLVLIINQIEIIHYIYMIYPATYILAALGSFVVAFLVNLGLTTRVRRIKAVESLKSVE